MYGRPEKIRLSDSVVTYSGGWISGAPTPGRFQIGAPKTARKSRIKFELSASYQLSLMHMSGAWPILEKRVVWFTRVIVAFGASPDTIAGTRAKFAFLLSVASSPTLLLASGVHVLRFRIVCGAWQMDLASRMWTDLGVGVPGAISRPILTIPADGSYIGTQDLRSSYHGESTAPHLPQHDLQFEVKE